VICWEALFPDPFREFVRRGAEFMVNLTEEAWVHRSQASRLFFGMAVFRAVENGVPLVRAGNTGISALIDPRGVIRGRVTDEAGNDLGVSGILSTDIPARWADTFYTRHGDLFAQACVVVTVALLALAIVPGWMRRRRQLFALPTAAYGDRQR